MPLDASESNLGGLLKGAAWYLKQAAPPQGDFDPAGSWRQTYTIWLGNIRTPVGTIRLRRDARPDQQFSLDVDWRVEQRNCGFHHVRASVTCQADALGTPISWKTVVQIPQPIDRPIRPDAATCEASVQDGVVTTSLGRKLFADKPLKAWTCNWSLLEAVGRLGSRQFDPLEFTMLDFLDARKDDQRLSFMGRQDVTVAGKDLQLTGFLHVGRGILPYEYWVDEQHRLRFVVSGSRAYIAVKEEAKA